MFRTPDDVMRALRHYNDFIEPKTSSILHASRKRFDPSLDPFRNGFVGGIEERRELAKRMTSRLERRERLLLLLWYVGDLPITEIATRLGISRMHCYRLRKSALLALSDGETNKPIRARASGNAE